MWPLSVAALPGVATAVELAERGLKVAVIEANKIGWGATGRNGGQVTGSLSGEGAMHKQMSKTLGSEVEDFICTCAGAVTRSRTGSPSTASSATSSTATCMRRWCRYMAELEASYEEAVRRGLQ